MKVLVIGAHGATGARVVARLKQHRVHEPLALIRSVEQRARFDGMGVPTVLGDLEYPIDHAVRGCDAVIFAAGSGGRTGNDKTVLIDHVGGIRSAVAALENGATRFVMLSGLKTKPEPDPSLSIPHWRAAKGRADAFIMTMPEVMGGRGLDYSIVCPGRLNDEARPDEVRILPDIHADHRDTTTSRETLAAVLVGCLDEPATIGVRFGVMNGDVPVHTALKRLATS
jgi:hypothetical protein